MTASSAPPRLSILIFLSALAVLPMNMFVPSLPSIARELSADFALVNLAVAGYAAVNAVTHFFAGAFSDRFGRKPVALTALAIFTVASIGCSIANSIGMFLFWRMLQGVVIAGYSVSLAAIRDTSEEGAATSRIGYVSSAWAIAPMIGPVFGGVLEEAFGWRASFIAFALLGIAGLCLSVLHLKETNKSRATSMSVQIGGYRDLVRSRRFWAYALCMAFSIGTLYAFLGGAPLVATQLQESSSIVLGLYLGAVPAGFILGSFLTGRYGARYSPNSFIVAGRALTVFGLLVGLALYVAGATHPLAFFGPCVCLGLGNGMTMPAANARVLFVLPGLAGAAAGLAATLTVAGASLIAFASGLIVTASNAHYALLGVMLASAVLSLAAALVAAALDATSRSDRRP
jgi:DHA1 family bicyclomycin/chloramphenicol resistance-like MFS transporter